MPNPLGIGNSKSKAKLIRRIFHLASYLSMCSHIACTYTEGFGETPSHESSMVAFVINQTLQNVALSSKTDLFEILR